MMKKKPTSAEVNRPRETYRTEDDIARGTEFYEDIKDMISDKNYILLKNGIEIYYPKEFWCNIDNVDVVGIGPTKESVEQEGDIEKIDEKWNYLKPIELPEDDCDICKYIKNIVDKPKNIEKLDIMWNNCRETLLASKINEIIDYLLSKDR